MKLKNTYRNFTLKQVALFVRAWIEISAKLAKRSCDFVALFVRAWIEIWEDEEPFDIGKVALFVRAWIEIGEWN